MTPAPSDPGSIAPELRALNRSFATIAFGPDGRILRANNRFLRMFGYELEELLGRDDSLFAAKDAAPMRQSGQPFVTALRMRKDGTPLWVRSAYSAIQDGQGRTIETVAIVTDVSQEHLAAADERGQVAAIDLSHAVAHFGLDGTILGVNRVFEAVTGFDAASLVGRPHRILVDPAEADGETYRGFWSALAEGRTQAGEVKRVGRDGREVWLQATYSAIVDLAGRPVKIVKVAVDVTREKLARAEFEWQIAAIQNSHAVITFDMNGTIIDANPAFLDAVGYGIEEIRGRHHRIFVEPSHAHSAEYAAFWRELKQGRHRAGLYRRIDRAGREVWLQATYNPVFDTRGRPTKVVKYATVVTEERLQQADHQGQIAAIHKSQCVVSFALDGTILDANDKFLDAVGYRLSDVLGRHHRMFVPAHEGAGEAYGRFWQRLAQGEHQSGDFRRIGRGGTELWIQATYNPIFDMNGRPFKVVKYGTDITAQKLQTADFQGQIEAIRKVQGVVALTLDGRILDANAIFLETFGYRLDELLGRHHRLLVEPDYAESEDYAELWAKLRAGTFHSGVYKRLGKDGREIWLQASYNPILDQNGQPFKIVKFATDITSDIAMAAAFEDAKRQAQHDPATSLPNRTRLASFMASALPHPAARLVVFYIDLDHFKPINDLHGHPAGDRVLGEVADRLRRTLKSDQLVARVGGDEFVVAAPDLDDAAAALLAQRLLDVAAAPIRTRDGELKVTASIGIAVSPADGTTPDELLRNADTALYRAKENGRATFSFASATMNERLCADRGLADDMRRGIAAREFFLEYQPRVDTASRAVRSVEALVRWTHPERGRIAPLDFIPLAERSGLIIPLGAYILETACRTIAPMADIGVSVNVSPIQFRDDGLVSVVAQALAASGLAGERLELEITEGVLMEDAGHARNAIAALKALGVKLAMDDFGTGYSSMSYLCDFPFDVIKIDRKFVSDIGANGSGRAVVQAILGLGRSLGLTVTAEGVETNEQLAMLTHNQCREVQGFLMARPMPADRLAEHLAGQAGEAAAAAA